MKVRLPDKDTTGIDLTRTDYIGLRDYFAAKAMQGFCANPEETSWNAEDVARNAYDVADAMIKASKQTKR